MNYRESSRQLAESVSSTLSDEEKARAETYAAEVAAGLRELCAAADRDEIPVRFAHIIARMMARLQAQPLMQAAETLDSTMIVYSLAAGDLADVYALPKAEGSQESSMSDDEWETFIRKHYL